MTAATPASHRLSGACHCGAIRVTLAFTRPAPEIQVRSCQCGFCTRHGAMTVSDPAGKVSLDIDQTRAGEYQFAMRSSKSLICRSCGIYAGALLEVEGRMWSAINVRGMGIEAFRGRLPEPVDYDGESAAERTARRQVKWTPTEVHVRYNY